MVNNSSKTDTVSPSGFKNCSPQIFVVLLVANPAIAGDLSKMIGRYVAKRVAKAYKD